MPMPGVVKYTGSHYEYVLNMVRGMIEGTVDIFAFENELHKALDSSACMAVTVEKILQNIFRQVSKLRTYFSRLCLTAARLNAG